jgi:hypothetical protein
LLPPTADAGIAVSINTHEATTPLQIILYFRYVLKLHPGKLFSIFNPPFASKLIYLRGTSS